MTRENASGVMLSVLSKKVLFIEEKLLLILIASGWILLAHDKRKMQAVFCSACCQKSAGLERLDLIDFSVILCIEKEGKKCQKKVRYEKVKRWKCENTYRWKDFLSLGK